MSDKEIKVPNIGEFKHAEVIEVTVSNGQSISKNDPLITIESDKSSVEIPSSFEGKIKSVNVKVGDKVSEGDLILTLENSDEKKKDNKEKSKNEGEQVKTKIQKEIINKDVIKENFSEKSISRVIPASPKTRKFARELGLDINQISGSKRQGRVVEDDIKKFVSSKINNTPKKIISEFSHSDFGEVDIKDIPRVKKLASTYLINS